ncbi:MAG TPA: DivIVA domain-containing protein [Mycobacteriales bacterium]|jgi:DivIVA domain-containing protein|nr:DivIVA domain-containing protein [Mycobacteriales bacterium]
MVLFVEIVVVAVVIFAVAALLAGRFTGMSAVTPDATDDGLPPDRLAGADLDRARFGLAFRGYRMGEVDAVLDRLRDQMQADAAELARLRQSATAGDDEGSDG